MLLIVETVDREPAIVTITPDLRLNAFVVPSQHTVHEECFVVVGGIKVLTFPPVVEAIEIPVLCLRGKTQPHQQTDASGQNGKPSFHRFAPSVCSCNIPA